MAAPLPEDYVAWLALHDGAGAPGPFPWKLNSLAEAMASKQLGDELATEMDLSNLDVSADVGLEPVWWHPKWLPIVNSGSGDSLCLDLAPTAAGQAGQVIEFLHDEGRRRLVSPSFLGWLESIAAGINDGSLVATDGSDEAFAGVLPRSALTGSLADLRIRGESESDWLQRIQREIVANPMRLAQELLPRLQSLGLLSLDPSVSSLGPSRFTLLQSIANAVETTPSPEARDDAIVRALRANPLVRALTAGPEDLRALMDTVARGGRQRS